MRDLADQELWALAGVGDAEAFGVLFERHARSVYNFCFRRSADWALAEDLTSVVFLQAWRHRTDPLRAPSALPFLLGIALHALRDQVRSLRRFRRALERVPPPIDTPDFASEVAERLDEERTMRQILDLVKNLRRSHQDVLLCAWSGLTYEETAIALDLPIGTVRSRLSRARTRLRELASSSGHLPIEVPTLANGAFDSSVEVEES